MKLISSICSVFEVVETLQKIPCFVVFLVRIQQNLALSSYYGSVFALEKVSVFPYIFIRRLVNISTGLDISCYKTTMLCNSNTSKDIPSLTLNIRSEFY